MRHSKNLVQEGLHGQGSEKMRKLLFHALDTACILEVERGTPLPSESENTKNSRESGQNRTFHAILMHSARSARSVITATTKK